MIELDSHLLIGRGSERHCYRHPLNPERCIKVPHYLGRHKQQNEKDFIYYRKLAKRGVEWTHIPRCFGWTETDKGPGLVFELMQDDHGQPLPSIYDLLQNGTITIEQIEPELETLHQYMVRNLIFTSDMGVSNIVCRLMPEGHYHLYIIDGLGDRDFIKLAAHCRWFGLRKVERQWHRFYTHLDKWRHLPVDEQQDSEPSA